MIILRNRNIVCISPSYWNRPWGSKQQLMLRLSANNRVLYVEYQASFLHLFFLASLFSKIERSRNCVSRVNRNLFVFTPYPHLPFGYYFRTLNRINQNMILQSLRKILKRLNFTDPILWVYLPSAVDLLDKLNEKFVVYHCIADFPSEKKNYLRNRTLMSMERELVERSDIVLTLTESLYKRHKGINANTHLFPSAVDENLFSPSLYTCVEEPKDIANLKRPRIGMAGYLDGRILDIDLLCYVADRHPEWSVVLIGPKFRHLYKFRPLARRDNVFFLGEKKNSEIPVYIRNLDVCIIPYVVNEFTNNVSPLKMYEYLALGKPVISTRFADLERFDGIIKISKSREDFVRDIGSSLIEHDRHLVDERLDFARENSWDARLRKISELIESKSNE